MAEYISPEVVEKLREAVKAFNKIGEAIATAFTPAIKAMNELWHNIYGIAIVNNTRVYYLSQHSKKARVRKKNINRLLREAIKG